MAATERFAMFVDYLSGRKAQASMAAMERFAMFVDNLSGRRA